MKRNQCLHQWEKAAKERHQEGRNYDEHKSLQEEIFLAKLAHFFLIFGLVVIWLWSRAGWILLRWLSDWLLWLMLAFILCLYFLYKLICFAWIYAILKHKLARSIFFAFLLFCLLLWRLICCCFWTFRIFFILKSCITFWVLSVCFVQLWFSQFFWFILFSCYFWVFFGTLAFEHSGALIVFMGTWTRWCGTSRGQLARLQKGLLYVFRLKAIATTFRDIAIVCFLVFQSLPSRTLLDLLLRASLGAEFYSATCVVYRAGWRLLRPCT